jgi:hypothetical protein
MAAMFVSAVGSFQSCKDYDGDIAKIEQNASVLQGQVTSLQDALNTAKSELAAAKAAADKAVKAAEEATQNGADANAVAKEAKAAVDALAKTAVLQNTIDELEKAINDVKAIAEGKVDQKTLDSEIAKVAGRIDAIDPVLNQLTEGIAEVATLKGQVESNKKEATEAIEALRADFANQQAIIDSFKQEVATKLASLSDVNVMEMLEAKVAEAEASVSTLMERINQIDANTNSISEIKSTLEGMQASINDAVGKMDNVSPDFSTLNVFVDNALTSLVLKPTLYYGGIEAVEAIHGMYQPIGFSIYYADDEYNADRADDENALQNSYDPNKTTDWRDQESAGYAATSTNAYDITYEYAPKNDLIYKYPVIDAYYHINPKHLTRAEIGDIALNTEDRNYVNTTQTRAEKNSLDIALDVCGPQIYKVENGLLHAYFTNSADMWHRVELDGSACAGQVTVVSLEATAPTAEGTRTVTSDWGAIARVHQHNYCLADNDATIGHYETYPHIDFPQDTDCGMMDRNRYTWTEDHVSSDDATRETKYNKDIVHIYRQARWAIENEYTHTLKWDGTPVDLDEVIEVHALHHYYDSGDREFDLPVDFERLGFKRKYTICNYQYPATQGININGTEESQHAHIAEGHLLKANFVTNGKRDRSKTSRTSIGREPLVMIELIDTLDEMTWNPDHMNWEAVAKDHSPRHNLVAVGFIKFKIVDETDPQVLNVKIDLQNSNLYASCAGDTVLTNWYEVEEQILDAIKHQGLSISKSEFEKNYVLRNVNGVERSFSEIAGDEYVNGQVYIPYTRKTNTYDPTLNTQQNWVASVDLSKPENWVLPQVVLNGDVNQYDQYPLRPNAEQRFVDPDRYGDILYTNYDWLHRETNLIGLSLTAEQMLQQLVKRDHEGVYLDSLGNKVAYLSEADFYPYVDTRVAAKLVDVGHNGWPEVTIWFQVRVHLNKATMNRPLRDSQNGNWYKIAGVYGDKAAFVNANIDAFKNGDVYQDVRRFTMNLQQCLKNQRWLASLSNYPNAFDFLYNEITGDRAAERIGIQRAKLGRLHGDLYFYTKHWLGDIEEGTPYWHDGTKSSTVDQYNHAKIDIKNDKFYADKYLIKVCYTKNPLDTVVWAQEAAGKRHIGKLGKYLFAYKYVENHADYTDSWADKTGDPRSYDDALVHNYTHYDMTGGELIAWIDNYDTHQAQNSNYPYANLDREGNLNENVNVHYNFNSKFAQDLLNRAGRYAENNSGTQDGYSKKTDNPFSVHCHLSLFEGDCILAVNPVATERAPGQDYIVRPDYVDNYVLTDGSDIHHAAAMNYVPADGPDMPAATEYHTFFHRPAGVPVMLNNPDFVVRFLRPLNVEFKTPWQNAAINAVEDATASTNTFTVTYTSMFRDQTGSPYSRIFPMDWRNYTEVKNQTEWIQFYQGKMKAGVFNDAPNDGVTVWNQAPWKREAANGFGYINGFKYMDLDRSSINRGSNMMFYNWNNWVYTPNYSDTYADSWNEMNVVPMVDHMLTNYDGTEGFLSNNIAIMDLQINHNIDPTTGNIKSTTFTYTNDLINRGGFDIIIPVTVKYAWGDITTTGKWEQTMNIQRTNDRYFHNANMNYIKVHFGPTIAN